MSSKNKNGKNASKFSNGSLKLNDTTTGDTPTSLTSELEQQFETELCWCIQQLQVGLKSGKLNTKQVQEHTKALNSLMSNSAPLIKKRQIMRLSFGDYRAKMAAEEKKHSKNAINMKVKQAVPSKKSVFVKKSNISTTSGSKSTIDSSSNDELNINTQSIKFESDKDSCQDRKDFTFTPSDNNFRFSFDIDEQL